MECTPINGAESWTWLLKADENQILAAEMWFWRRMMNISWKEKRTNLSILEELNITRASFKGGQPKLDTLAMLYVEVVAPLLLRSLKGK